MSDKSKKLNGMMTLQEYLTNTCESILDRSKGLYADYVDYSGVSESILSKDTGIYGYGPKPNKDSIVRWCEEKGFEEVQWKRFLSSSKHKTFIVGPNTEKYQDSNWISVQKDMFGKRIVFWFTDKGDINEIKKCESGKDGKDEPIDFDEAIKEIESMS